MALTYLVAWALTVIAIALVLFGQQWAYAIFVPGAITLSLWAYELNGRDPAAADRVPVLPTRLARVLLGIRPYQVTWYRVTLGIELPRAARMLTADGEIAGTYAHSHVPPNSRSGD